MMMKLTQRQEELMAAEGALGQAEAEEVALGHLA